MVVIIVVLLVLLLANTIIVYLAMLPIIDLLSPPLFLTITHAPVIQGTTMQVWPYATKSVETVKLYQMNAMMPTLWMEMAVQVLALFKPILHVLMI
jgi:hypothetical protein